MEQANGVYGKVLSKADITQKMSVPTDWVGEKSLLPMPKPGQPMVLPVKKQNGNATTLRLKVRSRKEGQKSYHMKPVFMSKEWRALVEAYDLKKGDRVYFWREGNYLRVKVRTRPHDYKIKLFGVHIYG